MLVLCISLAVTTIDQVVKRIIFSNLNLGQRIPVIPDFFNITYGQNTGAAWGIFQGGNAWLIALSLVVLTVLFFFRSHFFSDGVLNKVAMGLMIGGILGNLIDRVHHGFVVDFLDFIFWGWHFPAFNVADSGICVGVALYMLAQFISGRHESKPVTTAANTGDGAA